MFLPPVMQEIWKIAVIPWSCDLFSCAVIYSFAVIPLCKIPASPSWDQIACYCPIVQSFRDTRFRLHLCCD